MTTATPDPDVLSFAKTGDVLSFVALSPQQVLLCGTGPEAVRDKFDGYCIHWAAGCGHVQCVRWLVEVAGADPSIQCKGSGRQPSHYAARNGHLSCLEYLLECCGCDLNALAKHDVTPLQLAVWQNQQAVAEFLCASPRVQACPLQVNSFACSLVHWLATATRQVGGEGGVRLLAMAEWLLEQGCDFFAIQRSGHTVLHKAAWGGHLVLCRWLHFRLGVMDCTTDQAGNYAADCATMGRHPEISSWLRAWCSPQRGDSLRTLGLDPSLGRPPALAPALTPALLPTGTGKVEGTAECQQLGGGEEEQLQALILGRTYPRPRPDDDDDVGCAPDCASSVTQREKKAEAEREAVKRQEVEMATLIRNAYLEKARQFHPDRHRHRQRHRQNSCSSDSSSRKTEKEEEEREEREAAEAFLSVQRAYEHLSVHGGRGQQHNARHDLKTMISSLAHSPSPSPSPSQVQAMAVSMAEGGDGDVDVDSEEALRTADDRTSGQKLGTVGAGAGAPTSGRDKIEGTWQEQQQQQEEEEAASPLLFFKARLLTALLDYTNATNDSSSSSGGMPASSLRKKWSEIWPDHAFPSSDRMHAILDQLDLDYQHQHQHQHPLRQGQDLDDATTTATTATTSNVDNKNDMNNDPTDDTRSMSKSRIPGRSKRRNKCKKIKVLSFLKAVASDCCRVEDSRPGVEPVLFAIQPHVQLQVQSQVHVQPQHSGINSS